MKILSSINRKKNSIESFTGKSSTTWIDIHRPRLRHQLQEIERDLAQTAMKMIGGIKSTSIKKLD
jgi:hypothetical protein